MLPIAFDGQEQVLTVAITEVFNVVALDQLRATLGQQIKIKTVLAGEAQLEDHIDQFYGHELSVDGILREIETGEIDYQSLQAGGDEYQQPIVRLVGALLVDAVKRGASDIHFEPEFAFLRIRYRIDGVLEQVRSLHKNYWPGIAVRVKVISGMNIAETRAPQDGRISLNLNGRPVDFRVATQPTIHGENIVLRVLDREKSIISLDQMSLPKHVMNTLSLMLARPEGILVITGPTGSGKTTTLYSLLSQLNVESVNIMTLEDPVEYPVALMRQTSVNEAAKMDFVNGIRSMMRQDPDIILVGEVRDKDTAEMAFRAAMTGHQVFTTLHTNSALGAFPAAARHRHPARHHRRQRHRHHRAAPGAPAVHPLQGGLRARAARSARSSGSTPDAEHQDLPAGRLQALQLPRLPRAHRDPGDPAHGRRSRRAGSAPRHRAGDAHAGAGEGLPAAGRRGHRPHPRRQHQHRRGGALGGSHPALPLTSRAASSTASRR